MTDAEQLQRIAVFVPGKPAAQGSKRAFQHKNTGKIVMLEQSKRVRPWREDIRQALLQELEAGEYRQFGGAVSVQLTFVMPRPASTPKTRPTPPAIKRPDLDKLCRLVLDSITSAAGVWRDDSQVTQLTAHKRLAEPGETTGVVIEIEEDQ